MSSGRSVSAIGTSYSKHPETELAERIALCSRVLEGYGNGVSVEASTRCSWTFSPSTSPLRLAVTYACSHIQR